MSLFLRNIFCFLLLTGCLSGNIFGQISSNTADFKTVTAYSPHDTIFVFYQWPKHKLGSLTAHSPDTVNANFEWSKFDTTAFNSENNVIDNLKEGGYKVRVTDTLGLDTSFVAWVVFDSLHIQITHDNEGFVPYFSSTCDHFDLTVIDSITLKAPKPVNFKYFNPARKDTAFEFKNKLKFEWRATIPQSEIFATDTIKNWTRVTGDNIPSKNTPYYVSVTDKFGLTQNDDVVYKSIVPKAKITESHETTDGKNSAPLIVHFTNSSENAVKFTLYMGDGDTLEINDSIQHTYYSPATYKIKLIAESKEQCIATDTLSITVDPPYLKVPNVFVPDRGNFTFKAISLHYYKMTIFTRWGKKVYEETAFDKSYPITGWNGKIGNSDASEGIYFYIIEVKHWDPHPNENTDENRINDKGRYSGFFYLFR